MDVQNNIEQRFKLPEDPIAEKMVLAAIITNSNLVNQAIGGIDYEIFFDKIHQEIFQSITKVYDKEKEVNFSNITKLVAQENKTECLEKLQEIKLLANQSINSEAFEKYLYLIIDKFLRRSLIRSTLSLLEIVADEMTSVTNTLSKFEKLYLELSQYNSLSTDQIRITSVLPSVVKGIEEKYRKNNQPDGLYSGFTNLDRLTDGFQKSDLIIIASRPGMGKTAFILNVARNITKEGSVSLAFFSLEMTAEQLGYRILASESKIPLSRLRKGDINTQEWRKIQTAVKILSSTQLYIDDTPQITIPKLRNKIYRLLQDNENLHGVIIDYLQLIEGELNNENRYQTLSFITRSLKIIAREFNIPLIVLSQLSRNLESRTNKRPILADLRESGCLSPNTYLYEKGQQRIKAEKLSLTVSKLTSAVNNNKSVVTSSIKDVYISKHKVSYHLITKSGYYLEASANHKILTRLGWKALSSICASESIYLAQSYASIKEIYNKQHSHFLQLRLDEIESIYIYKKQHLLDLEMDKIHNFVANRIIVHNSIEQDADVVCMLYREAYYDTEQKDSRAAELAILKHRNGPTGKVELEFNSQFAEFTESNTP
nr:DnaB [Erythrotrichia longistipitata]